MICARTVVYIVSYNLFKFAAGIKHVQAELLRTSMKRAVPALSEKPWHTVNDTNKQYLDDTGPTTTEWKCIKCECKEGANGINQT